jgi:hypothetical protein
MNAKNGWWRLDKALEQKSLEDLIPQLVLPGQHFATKNDFRQTQAQV